MVTCLFKRINAQRASACETREHTYRDASWDSGTEGDHVRELTEPVDNIMSDASLGGNRKCVELGVQAQRAVLHEYTM
jgi:hypothetical protein